MPKNNWNRFQQQYAGMGYSVGQIAGMYQDMQRQQCGGSTKDDSGPTKGVVIRYDGDNDDTLDAKSVAEAIKVGKNATAGFLKEIVAHKSGNISKFRNDVWQKFLGNEGAVNTNELKKQILEEMPQIEVLVGNELHSAATEEVQSHIDSVGQQALDLLELA